MRRDLPLLLMAAALGACATPPAAPPVAGVVQLNQVGFTPAAAKWAALPDGAGPVFRIVDEGSGREVLRGQLQAPQRWPEAGQVLRLADFSSLQAPGAYRLQADGLADAPRFVVAGNAYDALVAAALKAFYFNRAGIALDPAHAGAWARPAGHVGVPVSVHASAAGPGRPAGTRIESAKGWYDAGDYGQYVVNSGITVYTLLAAWEHFPSAFRERRIGLPESGNGLPDLLNETLWNLEWMLSMQDPADGGVYHKLTTLRFDGTVMPHEAGAPRVVVQKTTAATLDFAASMAVAARVFEGFERQRPGFAARARQAALAAWAWAQAHPAEVYRQPADVHTGEYGDPELADEFAWAAAELYITTRDDRFWAAMKPRETGCRAPWWGAVEALGWMSLAHHREHLTPAADPALITQRITTLAAELQARAAASPVRVGISKFNWGSNSGLLNEAMMLVQAHRLTGERPPLDAAQAALDYVLGRNATGMSMVTGIGTRPPLHPHHRPSEADGVAAPVPGFLVGGPNEGRQDAQGCTAYPSQLPARSYLDHYCSYASNEVAINWNAPLVYVAAALQELTR